MIFVKVFGLPERSQGRLALCRDAVLQAFARQGITPSHQVSVLFVPDSLEEGLGEEVLVEISGLETTLHLPIEKSRQDDLCERVGKALLGFVPKKCKHLEANVLSQHLLVDGHASYKP